MNNTSFIINNDFSAIMEPTWKFLYSEKNLAQ